jgi:hypothetical protein
VEFADLEIQILAGGQPGEYLLRPELRLPGFERDIAPEGYAPLAQQFDLAAFAGLEGDHRAYGEALSCLLFIPEVRRLLDTGRAALLRQTGLRLRLNIDPGAAALHHLRWELLPDPLNPTVPLAANENLLFSRYLSSPDLRPARLRPGEQQRALVLLANPRDLREKRLDPIDVSREVETICGSLGSMHIDLLCAHELSGRVGPPTLTALRQHLHSGYDLLYLVCHGRMDGTIPLLWLEDEAGRADIISADYEASPGMQDRTGLMDQIRLLPELPRLVILASCQSAGSERSWGSDDLRLALGPRLARAGVPAVIAMRGDVTQETAGAFLREFLSGLNRDGLIDRAAAAARAHVKDALQRADWWSPVLFMSLRDGSLLPDLRHETGRRRTLRQVPALKPNFVSRPDVVLAVKDLLLSPDSQAAMVRVGLHGLAGSGKTTIAQALALDSDVQTRYPDGVLWVTLGQAPNLLQLLAGWVDALASPEDPNLDPRMADPQTMRGWLNDRLAGKSILMVIDDAWSGDHLREMVAGGPGCALLITTRDASIIQEAGVVGANLYELDVMSPGQALALLSGGDGRSLDASEQPVAAQVADELGYLPLALELAAAQALGINRVPWPELLDGLKQEIAYLEGLEPDILGLEEIEPGRDEDRSPAAQLEKRKQRSLLSSLTLSLRRLSDAGRTQFAWFGVLPDDTDILPAMAATLWGTNERVALQTLRFFHQKALLSAPRQPDGGGPVYRLHDVLHEMAKRLLTSDPQPIFDGQLPGLGMNLPDAHARLLDRYRRRIKGGLWHTLPADGYIHEHLVWHLERAALEMEIAALLREENAQGRNGWFEAREALGQSAGYAQDLRKAWMQSQASALGGADQRLRWTLMLASLNSLAYNLPHTLLARLVEEKIWSLPHARSYADRSPDLARRARALAVLAPFYPEPRKSETLRLAFTAAQMDENSEDELKSWLVERLAEAGLLPEAMEIARSVRSNDSLAIALGTVAGYLEGSARRDLLTEVVGVIQATEEVFRSAALLTAVPLMDEPLLRELIAAAVQIQTPAHRGEYEVVLYMRLAELGFQEEAFQRADTVSDPFARADALANLLPHLGPPLRAQAQEAVLAAILALDDTAWRAGKEEALKESPSTLRSVVMVYYETQSWRVELLDLLLPDLPRSGQEQLAQLILEADDPHFQSKAMVALVSKGPADGMAQLWPRCLAAARALQKPYHRACALAALAAGHPEVLEEVWAALGAIDYHYKRREAILQAASLLPAAELEPLLRLAGQLSDENGERASALGGLAPFLPPNLLEQAVQTARSINDGDARLLFQASLAPGSDGPATEEILGLLPEIENSYLRAKALAALAPRLPPTLHNQAVALANRVEYLPSRAEVALPGVANALPEPLRTAVYRQAIALIDQINDGERAAWALGAQTLGMPEALVPEALAAARRVVEHVDPEWAAYSLVYNLLAVVPRLVEPLKGEVVQQALQVVGQIREEKDIGYALAALGQQLSPEQVRTAVEMVLDFDDPFERAMACGYLIEYAGQDLRETIIAEVGNALDKIEPNEFDDVASMQERMLARVLPWLSNTSGALDLLNRFKDGGWKWVALKAFAPGLPAEFIPRALEMAASINPRERAEVLLAFAPRFSGSQRFELLRQALESVLEDRSDLFHNDTLYAVCQQVMTLPESDRRSLWSMVEERCAILPRPTALDHLVYLVPLFAGLAASADRLEAYHAVADIGRWWP